MGDHTHRHTELYVSKPTVCGRIVLKTPKWGNISEINKSYYSFVWDVALMFESQTIANGLFSA